MQTLSPLLRARGQGHWWEIMHINDLAPGLALDESWHYRLATLVITVFYNNNRKTRGDRLRAE